MKFRVRVSQLRYGDVVVEADSKEEAEQSIGGKQIDWFDAELTDVTAERID